MKTYRVNVQVAFIETYWIEAESADDASEQAEALAEKQYETTENIVVYRPFEVIE